jgi:hypothetical protein
MAKTSLEDFKALVRRAGLALTPEQIDEIYIGWGHVEPMFERIRSYGRDRAAEPAHVFRPDFFTQDAAKEG